MPVDPEALARDPEVREALGAFMVASGNTADDCVPLISTILARYRATRATTGPVLDFEAARAEAIARSAAGYDTEAHAYDAALEQQAAERVGALEARIKELEAQLLGDAVADDLHIRYRAAMMWLEQNNHSLLVTADGRWWVPDYPLADSPYAAIEAARLSDTRKEAPR